MCGRLWGSRVFIIVGQCNHWIYKVYLRNTTHLLIWKLVLQPRSCVFFSKIIAVKLILHYFTTFSPHFSITSVFATCTNLLSFVLALSSFSLAPLFAPYILVLYVYFVHEKILSNMQFHISRSFLMPLTRDLVNQNTLSANSNSASFFLIFFLR